MAATKKEIDELHIKPGKNGGHTVRHEFKRQPVRREGAMSGGMDMERPPDEDHVFGPGDGEKMIGHLRKHLNIGATNTSDTFERPTGKGTYEGAE